MIVGSVCEDERNLCWISIIFDIVFLRMFILNLIMYAITFLVLKSYVFVFKKLCNMMNKD